MEMAEIAASTVPSATAGMRASEGRDLIFTSKPPSSATALIRSMSKPAGSLVSSSAYSKGMKSRQVATVTVRRSARAGEAESAAMPQATTMAEAAATRNFSPGPPLVEWFKILLLAAAPHHGKAAGFRPAAWSFGRVAEPLFVDLIKGAVGADLRQAVVDHLGDLRLLF